MNHSWIDLRASLLYFGGKVGLGWGVGASTGATDGPTGTGTRQDGRWMADKFIYMARFIPKGNSECFTDHTNSERTDQAARKCSSNMNYEIKQQSTARNKKKEHKHTEGKVACRFLRAALPPRVLHIVDALQIVCVCVYPCTCLCVYTAHLCKGTFIPDEQICTVSVHREDHEMHLPPPD